MTNLDHNNKTYAIRFGLGAIKAVGLKMMEDSVLERQQNGKFKDVFDFAKRTDAKSINKKSIEALAKSGAFDSLNPNRRQISESFEILSSYSADIKEEENSNQMNLFGSIAEDNSRQTLKNVSNWNKKQKLTGEFEAFGFFLNEHPLDDRVNDLKLRGIAFSPKLEEEELGDNTLLKMAGVVASSKTRSGSRGRFAYLNILDPYGIFEVTIFDEALITANRDLIEDGSEIVIECLIKKDEGGSRILVRNVENIDDFITKVAPSSKPFEDIKKLPAKKNNANFDKKNTSAPSSLSTPPKPQPINNQSHTTAPSSLNNTKTINEIHIRLVDKSAVLPLKTILTQKLANDGNAIIYLIVNNVDNQKVTIALPHKYKIAEIDIFRLRNLHQAIVIEKIN